jgi:hypothetical protein
MVAALMSVPTLMEGTTVLVEKDTPWQGMIKVVRVGEPGHLTRESIESNLHPADMNECLSLNGGCSHNCDNVEGSFVCSCRDGFSLEADGRTCEDTDECQNSRCDHTCENLFGGFRCECREGYELDADTVTCNGKLRPSELKELIYITSFPHACVSDIDECVSENGGCAHNCVNEMGTHRCTCRDNFLLGDDDRTCEDIDECSNSECSHICTNLLGGFRCDCPEGYTIDANRRNCSGELASVDPIQNATTRCLCRCGRVCNI